MSFSPNKVNPEQAQPCGIEFGPSEETVVCLVTSLAFFATHAVL